MLETIENKIISSKEESPLDNKEDKKQNLLDYYSAYNINTNNQLLEEIIKVENKKEENMLKRKQTENEKIALLSEKEGLKRILRVIQDDLNLDEENLEETYKPYLNNEDMTKRVIKDDTGRCTLIFMYYIISPLFSVINLMGIFESLLMMKILLEVLKNSIISFYYSLVKKAEEIEYYSFYDFNTKYNYYYMFFDDAKKDSFDFNLMIFTAFLGDLLLQSRGFRVSTFIFTLINIGSIFLILSFSFIDYDPTNNTYNIFKILYLILGYILLLIGAGASALLSQKIIIDSNMKYNDYIIKLNDKSLELIEEQKMKNEIKREEKEQEKQQENVKLITLEDLIKSDDVKNDNENNIVNEIKEENIFPFKKGKSETIKYPFTIEKIDNNEIIDINKGKDDNNINSLKDIKNNIKEVNRRKIGLNKSKTIFVTERDQMKDRFNKRIQYREMRKKQKEEAKANIKKHSKFDSFFMVCITTIIGYFLKYLTNIIIAEKNNLKIEKYISLTNCGNDNNCFQNLIKDVNLTKNDKDLFEKLVENAYNDGQNCFYIILIIYVGCIVASILLYSFFVCIFHKNKKKVNEEKMNNKYRVCEICGYIIYSQNIILNFNVPCCNCCKLLCETFLNCFNMAISSIYECISCNCGNDEEDNEDNNTSNLVDITDNISNKIVDTISDKNKNKSNKNNNKKSGDNKKNERKFCNCCIEYKESDYRKTQQFFCYCYQAQRKFHWFNRFLTNDVQKKLFPFMVEYFILQMLICAFEKEYFLRFGNILATDSTANNNNYFNDSNDSLINDSYSFLFFILAFFLFFYFTLSFDRITTILANPERDEKKGRFQNLRRLSLGILGGTHGILIFDGIFSLIFSSLYLANSDNPIFEGKNLFLFPILMNRFYYFTLIFYCISYSDEKRKFELVSSSTLISVYLFVINTIISIIRDYTPLKVLHIIQIIISCCLPCPLVIFIIITFFVIFFKSSNTCAVKVSMILCFSSFFCCFGGFWMTRDFFIRLTNSISEDSLDCSYDCLCECCYCWYDCFLCIKSEKCLNTKENTCCRCVNCCICYDCCYCCECFYCCGDECSCNWC